MERVGGRKGVRTLIGMATMIAKRDIASKWNQEIAPTIVDWRKGMDRCAILEKPIYEARGCPGKYNKIWGSWLEYHGLPNVI